jgi:subtilase family serine protease
MPDLRPIESRMLTGTVSIKNFGLGPSAASVATVVCQKVGARNGGHCPDPGRIPEFENGAYPNAVVVNVPALAAGQVYSLKLPFWDALVWSSGSYNLTVTADAGATVAETNEGNNVGVAVKVVP